MLPFLPLPYSHFLFPSSSSHSFFLTSHALLSKIAFCHDKSTTKIKQIWLSPITQSVRLLAQFRVCIYLRMGHCVRVIFMWTIFITECEVDHKLQKWRPIKEVIESHMWKKDQGKISCRSSHPQNEIEIEWKLNTAEGNSF